MNKKFFGTSGIRGKYKEKITEELATKIGLAVNTYMEDELILGRDPRTSGIPLRSALLKGITNLNVRDLGMAPTPLVAYACRKYNQQGIIITASHNPKEYNGFKFIDRNGMAFSEDKEAKIEELIERKNQIHYEQESGLILEDLKAEYMQAIKNKLKLKGNKKVLIDSANGAACGITAELLESYGYEVVKLHCKPDGDLPGRKPEPSKENLQKAAEMVRVLGCDIGFAHDGDADRMMAITDQGVVVDFDQFLAFLCKNIGETQQNNKVVITVDASMSVDDHLTGFEVIRGKVGDVPVANELAKHNAAFGGEPSGSYIFPEFGLWPDGIYAVFKTLQLLERDGRTLSTILSKIPKYNFTRTKLACPNEKKVQVMSKIAAPAEYQVLTKDGILMKNSDSQILIRPSGTEEYIRINVEAKNSESMNQKLEFWKNYVQQLISSS